jgi:hypothetical protein
MLYRGFHIDLKPNWGGGVEAIILNDNGQPIPRDFPIIGAWDTEAVRKAKNVIDNSLAA